MRKCSAPRNGRGMGSSAAEADRVEVTANEPLEPPLGCPAAVAAGG